MVGDPSTVAGARHAVLRQGRAEPGDPRRPRRAGLPVPRRRRVRRAPDAVARLLRRRSHASTDRRALRGDEVFTLELCTAEESDFVRFNRGAVRQAGSGRRSATLRARPDRGARGMPPATLTLSGDLGGRPRAPRAPDRASCAQRARSCPRIRTCSTPPRCARREQRARRARCPSAAAVLDRLQAAGARPRSGRHLRRRRAATPASPTRSASATGIACDELQPRLELLPRARDKAVKAAYAGLDWDAGRARRARSSAPPSSSRLLGRPARTICRRDATASTWRRPRCTSSRPARLGRLRPARATAPRRRRCCAWSTRARRLHPAVTIVENTARRRRARLPGGGLPPPRAACR